MSGIIIKIPGINFTESNLGKVTDLEYIPLTSISIISDNVLVGSKANLSVTYNPIGTSEMGVVWSIVSGSEYASINDNTGVLTIKAEASNSVVVVMATSVSESSIIDTKSITVTYLSSITWYYDDTVLGTPNSTNNAYLPCLTTPLSFLVGKPINLMRMVCGGAGNITLKVYSYENNTPVSISTIGTFAVSSGLQTISLGTTITLLANQTIGVSGYANGASEKYYLGAPPAGLIGVGGYAQSVLGSNSNLCRGFGYID